MGVFIERLRSSLTEHLRCVPRTSHASPLIVLTVLEGERVVFPLLCKWGNQNPVHRFLKVTQLENVRARVHPGLYPKAQSCFLLHSFKNCKPMRQNTIEGICQGNLKPLVNCPGMYDLSCLFRGELLGWSHGHLSQLEEDQINNFYSWLQPLT